MRIWLVLALVLAGLPRPGGAVAAAEACQAGCCQPAPVCCESAADRRESAAHCQVSGHVARHACPCMAPRETPEPQPVPLARSGPEVILAAPDQDTRVARETQEAPVRRPWTGSPAALAPASHNGVQALLGIWQT